MISFSFLNRWGIIGIIKSGSIYTFFCHYTNSDLRGQVPISGFPFPWDNTVYLGHVSGPSGEWITFDGYLKDFKFYNSAVSDSVIRSDYL
jgi:hypothetical protein